MWLIKQATNVLAYWILFAPQSLSAIPKFLCMPLTVYFGMEPGCAVSVDGCVFFTGDAG
jgi:hypothetical protein